MSVARIRMSWRAMSRNLALEHDRDRVGLLAGRAARRPDPQPAPARVPRVCANGHHDMRAEMIEMMRLAKELGVVGRDRVDETLDLAAVLPRDIRDIRETTSARARADGATDGRRRGCACCPTTRCRRARRRAAPDTRKSASEKANSRCGSAAAAARSPCRASSRSRLAPSSRIPSSPGLPPWRWRAAACMRPTGPARRPATALRPLNGSRRRLAHRASAYRCRRRRRRFRRRRRGCRLPDGGGLDLLVEPEEGDPLVHRLGLDASSVFAVAAFSSTRAEFCCVTSSICVERLVDLIDPGRLLGAGRRRCRTRCRPPA